MPLYLRHVQHMSAYSSMIYWYPVNCTPSNSYVLGFGDTFEPRCRQGRMSSLPKDHARPSLLVLLSSCVVASFRGKVYG